MLKIASEIIEKSPEIYTRVLLNDPQFLEFIFEDYQIVLSHSIHSSRIMKVITHSNQSGRERRRHHKQKDWRD